jgi:hypothetical protein
VFSTSLPVAWGTNTIVYAYGTYPATFAVAVQKITGPSAAPSGVAAGQAGLADDSPTFPAYAIVAMALAAGGAASAGRRVITATRKS